MCVFITAVHSRARARSLSLSLSLSLFLSLSLSYSLTLEGQSPASSECARRRRSTPAKSPDLELQWTTVNYSCSSGVRSVRHFSGISTKCSLVEIPLKWRGLALPQGLPHGLCTDRATYTLPRTRHVRYTLLSQTGLPIHFHARDDPAQDDGEQQQHQPPRCFTHAYVCLCVCVSVSVCHKCQKGHRIEVKETYYRVNSNGPATEILCT